MKWVFIDQNGNRIEARLESVSGAIKLSTRLLKIYTGACLYKLINAVNRPLRNLDLVANGVCAIVLNEVIYKVITNKGTEQ